MPEHPELEKLEVSLEKTTNVFWRNHDATTRFVFNQGGTRSGKTTALVQLMYLKALKQEGLVISIVSETMPHLRKGAMRDFFRWLAEQGVYQPKCHNKTNNTYTVGKSLIEFFSVDAPGRVHGPGRDILYCNEIQNMGYETFFHLAQRTSASVYADFNPTSYFWAHTEYIDNPDMKDRLTLIHSTYKDNPFCPPEIIKDILARAAKDANYKRVYIDGLPGIAQGLVYPDFKVVHGLPEGAQLIARGLDFGFTNHPTALIDVYLNSGELWLDERLYQYNLTNQDIYQMGLGLGINPREEVIADSAEPKSIEELYRLGWNIKPANKGKDSIRNGIDIMKRYALNVTSSSTNLINELRNYKWATDKEGNPTNTPADAFNHACDAMRYVALNKLQVHKNIGQARLRF